MTIDQQDKLRELQTKLAFVLRGLACLASDETNEAMRLTDLEAFTASMLGQELCEEMVKVATQPGKEILNIETGG